MTFIFERDWLTDSPCVGAQDEAVFRDDERHFVLAESSLPELLIAKER